MFQSIMNWFSGDDSTTFEPAVNINGLPMSGGVDIHGNVFGSTANDDIFDTSMSTTDSFSSLGSDSSWCSSNDSFSSGCDWNSL